MDELRESPKPQNRQDRPERYEATDGMPIPTGSMLAQIEMMLVVLERAGVDVTELRKNKRYKTRVTEAKQILSALEKLAAKNNVSFKNVRVIYVNSCRERKTKKKIVYKTSKRTGVPKGYEFLGTLRQEIIIDGEDNKCENR